MPCEPKCPRKGIVVPLVTPLTSNVELDETALRHLIEHVLAGGVSGVFVLGTTGEGPSLTSQTKRQVIEVACRQVQDRAPVLAGLIETSEGEILRLGDHAARQGAAGLVLAPPFYLRIEQDEVLAFLDRVVSRLPLPVFLYNIPTLTKIWLDPVTTRSAARIPNVAGFKDSSGDLAYFAALRDAWPKGFPLFYGPEEQLSEALALGANGGVCGGANLFPRLFVSLYNAATAGERDRAAVLQSLVRELSAGIHQSGPSYPAGLKQSLANEGLAQRYPAPPLRCANPLEMERICACLERIGPLLEEEGLAI